MCSRRPPASTESLDQLYARGYSLHSKIHRRCQVLQQNGLGHLIPFRSIICRKSQDLFGLAALRVP